MSSELPAGWVGSGLGATPSSVRMEQWMRRAIEVARQAPEGDVPVGAVLLAPGEGDECRGELREVAWGVNRREADSDPLGHAEIMAIRAAQGSLPGHGWRLEDCTLVVTLEPCAMCAGALLGARIGRIVFGAYEPKTGACGSVWDVPRESPLYQPEVVGGVLEEECADLLREFFEGLR